MAFKEICTRLPALSVLVCASLLTIACSSPERLTSKATPCATGEVKIVNSEFSRRGVTTAWCAECKDKLYLCATDTERSKVECRLSTPEDACH
ncbi:MAG TPA: hypothetical protein VMH26_15900 [Burkholderiales bacterium]|nr:hypothetical protein [Burkholderiales bacterium]